jgi:hypothetical protein
LSVVYTKVKEKVALGEEGVSTVPVLFPSTPCSLQYSAMYPLISTTVFLNVSTVLIYNILRYIPCSLQYKNVSPVFYDILHCLS